MLDSGYFQLQDCILCWTEVYRYDFFRTSEEQVESIVASAAQAEEMSTVLKGKGRTIHLVIDITLSFSVSSKALDSVRWSSHTLL